LFVQIFAYQITTLQSIPKFTITFEFFVKYLKQVPRLARSNKTMERSGTRCVMLIDYIQEQPDLLYCFVNLLPCDGCKLHRCFVKRERKV